MFKYLMEIIFIAIGGLILVINNLIIIMIFPVVAPILNVVGGLVAVIPSLIVFYTKYRENKEIEEQFILFVKDLTESINSGMTLPFALENSTKKNYGALSPHIQKIAAQVNWGIPFSKSLSIFSKNIRSLPVKRSIRTITETYKLGGKISDTLTAVSRSLVTIDKIRKERSASVHAQIITSYLIFFVFIFILIILQTFLIPALSGSGGEQLPGALGTGLPANASELYSGSFINFILVQGFFAGLATGKMAEGSVVAGLKHSVLLIAVGYTLFSVISQLQISFF
jgi:flagellar protein FlaJ